MKARRGVLLMLMSSLVHHQVDELVKLVFQDGHPAFLLMDVDDDPGMIHPNMLFLDTTW